MINLGAVVKTKYVRTGDDGTFNPEARVEVGDGWCGPRGGEGRLIPFVRPVVQVGD